MSISGDGHGPRRVRVVAPVGGGHALGVDVFPDEVTQYLWLRTAGVDGLRTLGWIDEAHPTPHALRWAELDLLARAAALLDPSLRHPGPLIALAARHVLITADEEIDAAAPMLAAAVGAPAVREWLYRVDARGRDITWQRTSGGDWVVTEGQRRYDFHLHTTRTADSTRFPFAGWRAALEAAEHTVATADPTGVTVRRGLSDPASEAEACWLQETVTDAPRGSLLAARFGASPLRAARRHRLNLTVDVSTAPDWSVPWRTIAEALDTALRSRGLGHASQTGARSHADGTFLTGDVDIAVHDDLDAGIAAIREVLRHHTSGQDTHLDLAAAGWTRIPL